MYSFEDEKNHFLFNDFVLVIADINSCSKEPCENNGTCTNLVNDYHCVCVAGFNGTNCENGKDTLNNISLTSSCTRCKDVFMMVIVYDYFVIIMGLVGRTFLFYHLIIEIQHA